MEQTPLPPLMTTAEQIATGPYTADPSVLIEGWLQLRDPDGKAVLTVMEPHDAHETLVALNAAYTRGQQDRWSLEELERIMVHVGIAVAEYDPFPNQVDERDFLANIRDNLSIEYGLVPKPDPSGLVQWTTPPNPEQR